MATFDIVILLMAAVTLLIGFSTGFIMQVSLLAGVILGGVFAGQLAVVIAPKLLEWTGAPPHIIGPLSYVIAFILILIVLLLIGRMAQSLLKVIKINFLNRLAGAIFSMAAWFLIASIVLNIVVEIDQDKTIIKENTRNNSYTYPLVKSIAPKAIPYLRFDWVNR